MEKNMKRVADVQLGLTLPTFRLWPAQTGAPAVGVVVIPGAGAWGAYIDIIAAAAITTDFLLYKVIVDTALVGFGLHEMQIYNATTTTMVYPFRVDLTATNCNVPSFNMKIPIYCAPNAQIQARAGAAAAADKIGVSLLVGTGI